MLKQEARIVEDMNGIIRVRGRYPPYFHINTRSGNIRYTDEERFGGRVPRRDLVIV